MGSLAIAPAQTSIGFFNAEGFALMQKVAETLCNSTLVPAAYRNQTIKKVKDDNGREYEQAIDNPNAASNAIVALNMAQRMGADPLMVMQNLYIVEGRPAWSSQWIIAAINSCGRFSPLRFEITELDEQNVEFVEKKWNKDAWKGRGGFESTTRQMTIKNRACIAWAIEKETGARIESPAVSIEMAVKEGWFGKNGSKWQTMPEVMLRYRTASFFGKLYAPEILMGLQTAEELEDITERDITAESEVKKPVSMPKSKSKPVEAAKAPEVEPDPEKQAEENAPVECDPETGEVIGETKVEPITGVPTLTAAQLNMVRRQLSDYGITEKALAENFLCDRIEQIAATSVNAVLVWIRSNKVQS